ncbi:hypothetical protein VNO77_41706 [Canavalia gladiata]|uniref:Epidermal patterning factor-like protein n=1 Tax=Canavalia gladiata TaxID=3824 RepID=A0AAN9JYZ4_CANGL
MEQTPKPKPLFVPLLFLILTHTCLVHSRNLPTSPSPAPASIDLTTYTRSLNTHEGRKAKPSLGSFPATCHSKCNQCRPCVPVEVSIRTMEEEQNQYYPIAWKCMCQSNIFSP